MLFLLDCSIVPPANTGMTTLTPLGDIPDSAVSQRIPASTKYQDHSPPTSINLIPQPHRRQTRRLSKIIAPRSINNSPRRTNNHPPLTTISSSSDSRSHIPPLCTNTRNQQRHITHNLTHTSQL